MCNCHPQMLIEYADRSTNNLKQNGLFTFSEIRDVILLYEPREVLTCEWLGSLMRMVGKVTLMVGNLMRMVGILMRMVVVNIQNRKSW